MQTEAVRLVGAERRGEAARRLRILAVANWRWMETRVPWAEQRVAALGRAGAEVEVLSIDCIDSKAGYLDLARALRRRLREERFDVVAPLYGSMLGLVCAMQHRAPCVLAFANSDLNGTTAPGMGRGLDPRSVPSMVASQLAAVLARGVSVRNAAMQRAILWPPARRAAEVIGSGVDTARFQPMDRALARRRRGLPEGGARVAFVALGERGRPSKRIDLARAAVARLPGVTLDVLGRVPHEEMPVALAAADVLVLTSAREGSPNCVKEALACAVPVVTVEVGDVREVIEGLRNCAIVADDPEAIAGALAAAIADGRGCPDGPARMAERYSLDAMAVRFVRFYERLIGW